MGGLRVIDTDCDCDGSLTLATFTVELVDEVTTGAVKVDVGEFPLTVPALIVPPPLTTNVAPDALLSPRMDALIATLCTPSPSSVTEAPDVSASEIGTSVTVADALFAGSALLVAVTVAEEDVTGTGAV
jgi:hypothetical protein